jgi:hypothetical protein
LAQGRFRTSRCAQASTQSTAALPMSDQPDCTTNFPALMYDLVAIKPEWL